MIGTLSYWFYITRGDITILLVGLSFGGGVAGVLGVPFGTVARLGGPGAEAATAIAEALPPDEQQTASIDRHADTRDVCGDVA